MQIFYCAGSPFDAEVCDSWFGYLDAMLFPLVARVGNQKWRQSTDWSVQSLDIKQYFEATASIAVARLWRFAGTNETTTTNGHLRWRINQFVFSIHTEHNRIERFSRSAQCQRRFVGRGLHFRWAIGDTGIIKLNSVDAIDFIVFFSSFYIRCNLINRKLEIGFFFHHISIIGS